MRRKAIVWPFVAGMIAGGAIIATLDRVGPGVRVDALGDDCGQPETPETPQTDAGQDVRGHPSERPAADEAPRSARRTPEGTRDRIPVLEEDPVADLRSRRLTLPVQGLDRSELRSSFDEQRSGGRRHEAIDVLSPRNTPVLAVEDGVVAKLFTSKAGGLTVYQFDPESKYAYYYAHLERYAAGLRERDSVKRGQVIGYVGTSGNAPPDTPHLHFAIFKLTEAKQWWNGAPIDPFVVWR